jgi:hypothetical protein
LKPSPFKFSWVEIVGLSRNELLFTGIQSISRLKTGLGIRDPSVKED